MQSAIVSSRFLNPAFYMPAAVILSVLLLYAGVFTQPYSCYDDDTYLLKNILIQDTSASNLVKLWSPGSIRKEQLYIPVTYSSFFMEKLISGALIPTVTHGLNLLLHFCNILLVFYLGRTVGISLQSSALLALLFGIHPMQSEAVVWAMGRKDLLSTLFSLVSILAFIGFLKLKPSRFLVISYLAFTLGALSKPSAIVLPAILIIFVFQFIPRGARKKPLLLTIPFLITSAGIMILNSMIPAVKSVSETGTVGLVCRFLNAISGWIERLFLIARPHRFYEIHDSIDQSSIFMASLICAAIFLLAFLLRKNISQSGKSIICISGITFVILFLPAISRIFSGIGTTLIADRYSYFPLALLFLIPGILFDELKGYALRLLSIAFIAISLLSVVYTKEMITSWNDSVSFWKYELQFQPKDPLFHYYLGTAYERAGKSMDAEESYLESLALDPEKTESLNNLGALYFGTGRIGNSIICFSRALVTAEKRRQLNLIPEITLNLSSALLSLGKEDEAILRLSHAVKSGYATHAIYQRLIAIYSARGEKDKATEIQRKAEKQGLGFAEK